MQILRSGLLHQINLFSQLGAVRRQDGWRQYVHTSSYLPPSGGFFIRRLLPAPPEREAGRGAFILFSSGFTPFFALIPASCQQDIISTNSFYLRVDAFSVQTILGHQSGCCSGFSEHIVDADAQNGSGCLFAEASQTAPPRPPMMVCSSAVTTFPVFFADFTMSSVSRGLMVWMLMTSALMPSAASYPPLPAQRKHRCRWQRWSRRCLHEAVTLSNLKLIVLSIIDERNRRASKAQIYRTHIFNGGLHCSSRSTASLGLITTIPGMARIRAISSRH